jgi:hypothetical protein
VPGTWAPLINQPPSGVNTMLLMTDGTVMCRQDDNPTDGGRGWFRLSPDQSGDYIHGTWAPAAPMKNGRRYFASAVLADGNMFVAGGEYSDGGSDLSAAELYEPLGDKWTSLPVPVGWTAIGDAPCCVLADGRVLLGSILTTATAIFDPHTTSWSVGPNKDDRSAEETWTLLPDGTVLTVECTNFPRAEKFVPSANAWISAGQVVAELAQASSNEIGPAVLMPDGRVFAVGATGHTGLYLRPTNSTDLGSWLAGPDFPPDGNGSQLIAKDAPACLLPDGHVLCAVSPYAEGTTSKDYPGPSYFFEFDGTTLIAVAAPTTSASPSYAERMLLLPTGQVLLTSGSQLVEVYTSDAAPQAAWAPFVTSVETSLVPGASYALEGKQLNGLSQAVSYGDDASMATNYPLVRIRQGDTGRVWYCRTHNHSSMGVATGAAIVSTRFDIPPSVALGPALLEVVANGIASNPVSINVTTKPPKNGGCTSRTAALIAIPIGQVLLMRWLGL